MNPAEVVPSEVQTEHGPVVLKLLATAIREARKTASRPTVAGIAGWRVQEIDCRRRRLRCADRVLHDECPDSDLLNWKVLDPTRFSPDIASQI